MKKQDINKETITHLINILGRFKDLKRRGWILKNCKTSESDAEHSFSLALLTLLLAPPKLDMLKCLKLALIHDLPEIYSQDYVPGEISPENKSILEKSAVKKLCLELQYKELENLFEEFTNNQTPESRFINALDKIDNVFTAKYYDNHNKAPQKLVPEFAQTAQQKVSQYTEKDIPNIQKLLNILVEE